MLHSPQWPLYAHFKLLSEVVLLDSPLVCSLLVIQLFSIGYVNVIVFYCGCSCVFVLVINKVYLLDSPSSWAYCSHCGTHVVCSYAVMLKKNLSSVYLHSSTFQSEFLFAPVIFNQNNSNNPLVSSLCVYLREGGTTGHSHDITSIANDNDPTIQSTPHGQNQLPSYFVSV